MHYDVVYEKDDPDRERKACVDALKFMECKQYRTLVTLIKTSDNESMIKFAGMISGVQGFPIEAMIRRYKRTIH